MEGRNNAIESWDQQGLEHLYQLHQSILAGSDADTGNVFATMVRQPLIGYLTRRRSGRIAELGLSDAIVDAVDDTIMQYLANPGQARARDGRKLWAHLTQSAWRDLTDEFRKATRYSRKVATHVESTAYLVQEKLRLEIDALRSTSEPDARSELAERLGEAWEEFRERLDAPERQAADLWHDGVRSTGEYAAVLGVTHLPGKKRFLAVKQWKDRITKRWERWCKAHGLLR